MYICCLFFFGGRASRAQLENYAKMRLFDDDLFLKKIGVK